MTIQIDLPVTTTERAIAEIRAQSVTSLVEAMSRDFIFPQRLLDPIWSAKSLADSIAQQNQKAFEVSQRFQAKVHDMQATARALAGIHSQINQPILELSSRLQHTITETQAIANRFDAIAAPIFAQRRRLEQTAAALAKPARNATIAASVARPLPDIDFRSGYVPPRGPNVRFASKAARIVKCALTRLRDRRRRYADLRHRVELIVSLPIGGTAIVTDISVTEDGLIRVCGTDVEEIARECFIAPEAIQYEIAVFVIQPPRTPLTVVE